MSIKLIKKEDYITTNWTGGETSQLFIYPKNSNLAERNFIFRVSSATCPEEESKFSDFTGYNRFILSLKNQLKLTNKGETLELLPFEVFNFDGEDETSSHSAVRDFNLIVKKGYKASVRVEEIDKEISFKNQSGLTLIFSPENSLKVDGECEIINVIAFDSILVSGEEEFSLESLDSIKTKIIIVNVEV